VLGQPELLGLQDGRRQPPRHRLARRQSDRESALEVARGERRVVRAGALAGHLGRQDDEQRGNRPSMLGPKPRFTWQPARICECPYR
jgi:hypothetical protein